MIGPIDYLIWVLSGSLSFLVVCVCLAKKEFTNYLALNIYQLASVAGSVGEWFVFRKYGFFSAQYAYTYYYGESLLAVGMLFVVANFYILVFVRMEASRMLRLSSLLILSATALVSFWIVETNHDHLLSRFVVELGRNLNFLGLIFTYILWMALMKIPKQPKRLVQLISVLGFFFSVFALANGIRLIVPGWRLLRYVVPTGGIWLSAAWAYTFLTTREHDISFMSPAGAPRPEPSIVGFPTDSAGLPSRQ